MHVYCYCVNACYLCLAAARAIRDADAMPTTKGWKQINTPLFLVFFCCWEPACLFPTCSTCPCRVPERWILGQCEQIGSKLINKPTSIAMPPQSAEQQKQQRTRCVFQTASGGSRDQTGDMVGLNYISLPLSLYLHIYIYITNYTTL